MRKKTVGIILYFMVCLWIIFTFTACGNPVANEEQIKADILESSIFKDYIYRGFEIQDVEIIKRKTSKELKADKVYVEISIISEKAEGNIAYILDYILYDNGWDLDNIEIDNDFTPQFIPLCGVSDEELYIYGLYNSGIVDITYNDMDLENGVQSIEYSYTKSHLFCDLSYTGNLTLTFDYINGWWNKGYPTEQLVEESWHAEGEGYLLKSMENEKIYGQINIYFFDGDYIECWYDDGEYSYLIVGTVVNVENMTFTEYADYGYAAFSHAYGKIRYLSNANWSDIKYALPVESGRIGVFIGYDHIYFGERILRKENGGDIKYMGFAYELMS